MARKRMLNNEIVGDERFKEMSAECQILYVFLNMAADDEGFVQPQKVLRDVQAKDESLKILMAKGFIIPLINKVAVIRHWKQHNKIRRERITATVFQDAKRLLQLHEDKYYLKIRTDLNFTAWNNDILSESYVLSDICPPIVRIDEIRLDKEGTTELLKISPKNEEGEESMTEQYETNEEKEKRKERINEIREAIHNQFAI